MSLGRAGLQCSGVFMVVSTVDPGAQELQRSHVIGGEPIAIRAQFPTPCYYYPVIFCPTRELNPKPLAQQSHLATTRPTRQTRRN
ncbi:hypothetical protein SFRURICE_010483 [Spodoptera frugiperda]|nr:hypothetical protein SFRURICE_010483 [Spodoptera frugiperda]